MISRLVAIELCKTACLCASFFKKRCQMGSIFNLSYRNQQLRKDYLEALAEGNNSVYGNGTTSVSSVYENGTTSVSSWILVSITGIFSLSYRKSATPPDLAVAAPSPRWGFRLTLSWHTFKEK